MIDDRDAIAELVGFVHVVRRDEHGQLALRLEPLEHFPHVHARHRIETGRRFVEKEDPRLVNQASRDFDAPPHAAREVLHLFVAPLRQLDRVEQFVDQPLPLFARDAVQLGVDDQVFFDAQFEIAGHRLRDDADRMAHAVGLLDHVEAVNHGRAGCRRQQRRQHADQRRLAGAVWSEQAEELAGLDAERDAFDGGEVAEFLDDVLNVDRRSDDDVHMVPVPSYLTGSIT